MNKGLLAYCPGEVIYRVFLKTLFLGLSKAGSTSGEKSKGVDTLN